MRMSIAESLSLYIFSYPFFWEGVTIYLDVYCKKSGGENVVSLEPTVVV